MPEYEFAVLDKETREDTGDFGLLFYKMSEAPEVGTYVEHDGMLLRRVFSIPRGIRVSFQPFVSSSQAHNDPDAPHHVADGRCAFNSRSEVDEFLAKKRAKGKPLEWDD